MSMFQKAMEIQLKILGDDYEDLATTFHSIAEIHYKQGELQKAAEFCQKALNIAMQSLDETDPFIDEANELMEKIQVDGNQRMQAIQV